MKGGVMERSSIKSIEQRVDDTLLHIVADQPAHFSVHDVTPSIPPNLPLQWGVQKLRLRSSCSHTVGTTTVCSVCPGRSYPLGAAAACFRTRELSVRIKSGEQDG